MNHLDLFSGIGGFALAAKWAEIETVQFVEINEFCQKVLAKNFPNIPIHDDIKTYHCDKRIDLMTGGFPCQPFSQSGKKKGKNDDRYLWPEMYRIIKQCRPTWIIAENVAGIIKMELDNILIDLERANYATEVFILPACAANAPHRRDRVWIIAYHNVLRSDQWISDWETRHIQENKERHISKIQSQWKEFKPEPWKTMQAAGYFAFNNWFSRTYDGLPKRMDRIKALGNAIVPQVVYPIMKIIKELK